MSYSQPWMNVAYDYLNTKEYAGASDNPEIMKWAVIIGGKVAKQYVKDSIPWCGLFVAICMAQTGIVPVKDPLWARNWANFGSKDKQRAFGSIMTFTRGSGGHVGFYVSEDSSYYHILGGNQSDTVNVTKIAKNRLIRPTWPVGMDKFYVPGLINKKFDGRVSTNEA